MYLYKIFIQKEGLLVLHLQKCVIRVWHISASFFLELFTPWIENGKCFTTLADGTFVYESCIIYPGPITYDKRFHQIRLICQRLSRSQHSEARQLLPLLFDVAE